MAKVFIGLKLNLAKPKKHRVFRPKRISNKLYEGVCYKDDGVWKIHVPYPDSSSLLSLEFTEASYSLRREVVFYKTCDPKFKYHIVHRREREWKYSPGLSDIYTPFCEDFIFKGYIVKINQKLYFDMISVVRRNDL